MKKQAIFYQVFDITMRILAIPIFCAVILLQWICIFLNGISSVIFGILSTLIWVFSLIYYIVGAATGKETLLLLGMGFLAFMIPVIVKGIVELIMIVRLALEDFISL